MIREESKNGRLQAVHRARLHTSLIPTRSDELKYRFVEFPSFAPLAKYRATHSRGWPTIITSRLVSRDRR